MLSQTQNYGGVLNVTTAVNRLAASVLCAGGIVLPFAGPAHADVAPGCTVADTTAVLSGVSTGMTVYLFTHPDVNNFLSGLQGMTKSDARAATQSYYAANPQVKAELDAIRAPAVDLRKRCNVPPGTPIGGLL